MKQKLNPHYLIYKITNLLNNKIYIGLHKTYDINDGYMGSGKNIIKAINEFGIENFKKEILFDFDNEEEMIKKEAEIVNEEFIKRDDVYNIVLGGNSGWNKDAVKWGKTGWLALQEKRLNDLEFNNFYLEQLKNSLNDPNVKARWKESLKKHFEENGKIYSFSGKIHSDETKIKMSKTHKLNEHQKGSKNSQYGKCWISNLNTKECISIFKNELESYIIKGWLIGRITNVEKFFEKYNDAMNKKEQWHFINYELDLSKNIIPRILKNKKKSKEENKNIQNHFLTKFDTIEEKIKILKEYFDYYCEHGFNGVVKKYNYRFTSTALVNAFKKYLPNEYYEKYYNKNEEK